jgi:arsenate reductase-like glutaredoxin family protein
MKKNPKKSSSSVRKLKNFLEEKTNKIKQHHFTCPVCREVLQGLFEFGAHLKKHCT